MRGDHDALPLTAAQLVGVTSQSLVRLQTDHAERFFYALVSLLRVLGKFEVADRAVQDVIDGVEGVVGLERVLEDGLHLAAEVQPVARPHFLDIFALVQTCPEVGGMTPKSNLASVVLPLPLSPAMAVIVGRSSGIASETSCTAIVTLERLKNPPPKILDTLSSSSRLAIRDRFSMQVALGAPVRFHFDVDGVGVSAHIHRGGAAWVEGTAGGKIQQAWGHTWDSDELFLLAKRRQAVDEQLRVRVLRVFEDLRNWPKLDQSSGVHDADGVGELRY